MKLTKLFLACSFAIYTFLPAVAKDVEFSRINAVVPFSEGGGSDTLVRILAPYLEKELPGKPTILVRNEPGGGGIPATNRFAVQAKKDGTDILALSSSIFIASALKAPQVKFNLDQFVPVFIAPMGPVLFVSPSTGATGPGDMKGIQGAKLVKGGGRQDSADILAILQFDLLGLDIQPVWGLERGAGRIGFERGEFNVDHQTTAAYVRNVQPLVDEGKAIPFMTGGIVTPSGEIVRDPNFPDLPTFMELYEQVHGEPLSGPAYRAYSALMSAAITTGKAIVLPADASEDAVNTYSAAFERVIADPDFKEKTADSLGGYELFTGEKAKALWGQATSLDDEAFKWLADWYQTKIGFELKR